MELPNSNAFFKLETLLTVMPCFPYCFLAVRYYMVYVLALPSITFSPMGDHPHIDVLQMFALHDLSTLQYCLCDPVCDLSILSELPHVDTLLSCPVLLSGTSHF